MTLLCPGQKTQEEVTEERKGMAVRQAGRPTEARPEVARLPRAADLPEAAGLLTQLLTRRPATLLTH